MDIIAEITKAAKGENTVIIYYMSRDGSTSQRETEPYEIRNGSYFGYCLESDGIRNFKIDKIGKATPTSNKFVPRWPIQIS